MYKEEDKIKSFYNVIVKAKEDNIKLVLSDGINSQVCEVINYSDTEVEYTAIADIGDSGELVKLSDSKKQTFLIAELNAANPLAANFTIEGSKIYFFK